MHTSIALRLSGAPAGVMFDPASRDNALIARVAKSDKRAFEALYDEHAGAALGLALKIIGERNTAEEIVQEAFWRVWKRAATFDVAKGKFTTWLFGIVHNLAIDELRRRKAQLNSPSVDLGDDSLAEMAGLEDVVESAFRRVAGDQVRAALAIVPGPQRQVLELAYFEGLTHQEIAERLGEPVGTIHTRARLALQKLREQLSPLHADDMNP